MLAAFTTPHRALNSSLFIRDVKGAGRVCSERCHQGLQLPGWDLLNMRPTSAVARSAGEPGAHGPGLPWARRAARAVRPGWGPLSPSGSGVDGRFGRRAGPANQTSQHKQNAQFVRARWRRIAVSERTWKSAQPGSYP